MLTKLNLKDIHTYKNNRDEQNSSRSLTNFPKNNNETKENLLTYKKQSDNINFKGNFTKVDEALKFFEKEVGTTFRESLEGIINQTAQSTKLLKYDKKAQTVEITQQGFLSKNLEILKSLACLPLDIANSTISTVAKIPGLKSVEKLQNVSFLKNRKIASETPANLSSIQGYLERHNRYIKDKADLEKTLNDPKADAKQKLEITKKLQELENKLKEDLSNNSLKGFSKKVGNYDSCAERSLTRIVTGTIPAFFLANDAYNLSMYMTNDKKTAKDAKRKRFIQEAIRIGLTAGGTFYGLKLFAQKSNASKNFNMLFVSTITFLSEIVGRLIADNPVLPVSDQQAEKLAKKRETMRQKHELLVNPNKKIAKNAKPETKTNEKDNKTKIKQVDSIITMKSVFGILGTMVLIGFGQEKLFKIKKINELSKSFINGYKKLFTKELSIKQSEFDELTNYIDQKGFQGIAQDYKNIKADIIKKGNYTTEETAKINAKRQEIIAEKVKAATKDKKLSADETKQLEEKIGKEITNKEIADKLNIETQEQFLYLGETESKWKQIIIDHILASPFKFSWTIISAPYKKIVKPLYEVVKKPPKKPEKTENNNLLFSEIISSYKDMKKNPNKNFEDKFNKKLLGSMDTVTKSSISNAELAAFWKNAANAITSLFLIIDNYNLVMIDSKGKDKKMAEQKAKERTLQRISKIIYGAFTIQLFNNIFARTFHGSLLGAQLVNSGQTLTSEVLERKTVGLPLSESNRDEIIEMEQTNLQATGIKGSFYRGMSKLTGKKALSARTEKQRVNA